MNKLFTLLLSACILFASNSLIAQSFEYNDTWGSAGYSVKQQKTDKTVVNFSIKNFKLSDIDVKGEAMKNISLPGHFLPNNEGAPNLPGNGRYIAIPNNSQAQVVITNVEKETIENVNIAPSPRIPKDNEDGALEYNKDQKVYTKNTFYPASPVKLGEKEMIRGLEVVMLGITPFQYNPVTKELVVYHNIEVEISYTGGTGEYGQDKYRSRWFDPILSDAVLNHEVIEEVDYNKISRNTKDGTGCEYLIVSPDGEAFQQWADSIKVFRNMQGIHTEVVTLSEIGANNTGVLEDYFDEAFNTWDTPPTAVLLLGDYGEDMDSEIVSPIWDSYCVSDNIYADVTGNSMPDIVFARITAQNEEQLEVMVSKFINYEKNPPTSESFYNTPITALGWQTERWFQICSESIYGFWQNNLGKSPRRENVLYSGSTDQWSTATNTETMIDYFGESGTGYIEDTPDYLPQLDGSAAGVNEGINNGAFMLQHRDHGGETGWGEPDYGNDDIDDLYNTDLTFIMSINCLTGKYNYSSECFAEKFHRYTNDDGANSGALGLIAASEVSYSFVNDTYVWGVYDNMWPEFLPDYGSTPEPRGIKPAFGNAAGKYYLEQSDWPYNTNNKEVTYNLFHHHGGAFLTVYSEVPQDLTVIHNDVLLSGPDFFEVTADEGSLIALSVDGVILGTAEGTGASVDVIIEAQLPGTVVDVVVTKQNYYRYHQQVMVIPPDGPYVIKNSYEIDDSEGNGNGVAEYSEEIGLSLTVENVGNEEATDVMVTLESDDPYITIIDGSESYGNIPAESTMTIENGFTIQVADDIPDDHTVNFNVTASGQEEWTSSFSMKIYAPVLNILSYDIVETAGNGNGRLDPGESADLFIEVENTGHCDAPALLSTISSTSPYATIEQAEYTIDALAGLSTDQAQFSITVDDSAPIGSVVDIYNHIESLPYEAEKSFGLKVGLIIEDWETGDLTNFDWATSGDADWQITTDEVYEGEYAVVSGTISDNQETLMTMDYDVMYDDSISFYVKASSESGYDYLKFYIDDVQKGQWSGEADWSRVAYPVTEGAHTFMWSFSKDGSVSSGSDCGWVDYIVLPPELATTAYAGSDIESCEMQEVVLSGASATYYESVTWTTLGTGTFDDATALNPTYTPSQEDFENGQVTLTMDVEGSGNDNLSDEIIIVFYNQPSLSGMENVAVCAHDTLTFEGIEATDYAACSWTTTGDGTFEDASVMNPVYVPGTSDIAAGEVTISMELVAMGSCDNINEEITITVHPVPTATVTTGSFNTCENSEYEITATLTGAEPWVVTINNTDYEVTETDMVMPVMISENIDLTVEMVTDNNGCMAEIGETINITMDPLAVTPATPAGEVLVDLYYVSATEYKTTTTDYATALTWTLDPAEAGLLTATDTTVNVEWDAEFRGNATLQVMGTNDCGDGAVSEAITIEVKNSVGVGEYDLAKQLKIYPNPSTGKFVIERSDAISGMVTIKVMNTISEMVYLQDEVNLEDSDQVIDLSNMQSGVYIMILETENNQSVVKRLIIQ